ncbi:hypothetical protein Thiowin_05105 [Thiorhodovibrio winogradskyi]|uniref:Uncharacterized protein n=1 Tax=Thiorhodovibrio winogradskyi TaxID=77007 RepID=A0ABZ0SID9_9GAMM
MIAALQTLEPYSKSLLVESVVAGGVKIRHRRQATNSLSTICLNLGDNWALRALIERGAFYVACTSSLVGSND